MEIKIDSNGKWEVDGHTERLIEPSAKYLAEIEQIKNENLVKKQKFLSNIEELELLYGKLKLKTASIIEIQRVLELFMTGIRVKIKE